MSEVLQIVGRIVETADPERIILFGSAARGTMEPSGLWYAKDSVIATPKEVERYKDSPCLVFCPALREGIVLYDTPAA
mgnify:CR=1 FL=1